MLKRRRSQGEFGDVLEGPARPGLLAPRSARPLDEGRQELELLAQALGREAHIVAGMPKLLQAADGGGSTGNRPIRACEDAGSAPPVS